MSKLGTLTLVMLLWTFASVLAGILLGRLFQFSDEELPMSRPKLASSLRSDQPHEEHAANPADKLAA